MSDHTTSHAAIHRAISSAAHVHLAGLPALRTHTPLFGVCSSAAFSFSRGCWFYLCVGLDFDRGLGFCFGFGFHVGALHVIVCTTSDKMHDAKTARASKQRTDFACLLSARHQKPPGWKTLFVFSDFGDETALQHTKPANESIEGISLHYTLLSCIVSV